MVFYSCDPGLVPERRMMSVCTGAGWSPNPGALGCSVGMLMWLFVWYLHGYLMGNTSIEMRKLRWVLGGGVRLDNSTDMCTELSVSYFTFW